MYSSYVTYTAGLASSIIELRYTQHEQRETCCLTEKNVESRTRLHAVAKQRKHVAHGSE